MLAGQSLSNIGIANILPPYTTLTSLAVLLIQTWGALHTDVFAEDEPVLIVSRGRLLIVPCMRADM